jgi:hypothetical protein
LAARSLRANSKPALACNASMSAAAPAAAPAQPTAKPPKWTPDNAVSACCKCNYEFSMFIRKVVHFFVPRAHPRLNRHYICRQRCRGAKCLPGMLQHHCRHCGKIFCEDCSSKTCAVPKSASSPLAIPFPIPSHHHHTTASPRRRPPWLSPVIPLLPFAEGTDLTSRCGCVTNALSR